MQTAGAAARRCRILSILSVAVGLWTAPGALRAQDPLAGLDE